MALAIQTIKESGGKQNISSPSGVQRSYASHIELLTQTVVFKSFTSACIDFFKKSESLDPLSIGQFALAEQEYSHETLGEAIHRLNTSDPIFPLIRIDPLTTFRLLQKEGHFRHLVYRKVLFNVSRDAIIRMEANKTSGILIRPELLPIFDEFRTVYQKYVSGELQISTLDLTRLYMKVLTWNFMKDVTWQFDRYPQFPNPPYRSIDEAVKRERELNDNEYFEIKEMPFQDTRSRPQIHDMFNPHYVIIPTFCTVSKKTLLKAWATGILFIGCTSRIREEIDLIDMSPEVAFWHDEENHIPQYLKKLKKLSAKEFLTMQSNGKKALFHLEELESIDASFSKTFEEIIFYLHHERGLLFFKEELAHVGDRWTQVHLGWTPEMLNPVLKYYRSFYTHYFENRD